MVTFITELGVAASFDAIYPYARSITSSSSRTTGARRTNTFFLTIFDEVPLFLFHSLLLSTMLTDPWIE